MYEWAAIKPCTHQPFWSYPCASYWTTQFSRTKHGPETLWPRLCKKIAKCLSLWFQRQYATPSKDADNDSKLMEKLTLLGIFHNATELIIKTWIWRHLQQHVRVRSPASNWETAKLAGRQNIQFQRTSSKLFVNFSFFYKTLIVTNVFTHDFEETSLRESNFGLPELDAFPLK